MRGGGPDGEELVQKCLVLHERNGRLRVIRDVLELLGGEGVVHTDRRAAGVDDGEVGDHVLGHVAGHDQAELARAEAQIAQRQGGRGDVVPVFAPVELLPFPVPFPAQGGPVGPVPDGVGEDRADSLSGDFLVNVGPLSRYVHVMPPPVRIMRRPAPVHQIRLALD